MLLPAALAYQGFELKGHQVQISAQEHAHLLLAASCNNA
jgi:hypothetical protein